jgi:hypothetical protein
VAVGVAPIVTCTEWMRKTRFGLPTQVDVVIQGVRRQVTVFGGSGGIGSNAERLMVEHIRSMRDRLLSIWRNTSETGKRSSVG